MDKDIDVVDLDCTKIPVQLNDLTHVTTYFFKQKTSSSTRHEQKGNYRVLNQR